MPMNARVLRPIASRSLTDADATAYLTAVQAADGQALEPLVRNAITVFVIGCKQDGIWSAIKASCILCGARTLSGALTPLTGTAPTNNNFVSGDYNRKTGLIGNGSTKSINTNRAGNSDPQNSLHIAAYVAEAATSTGSTFPIYIGYGSTGSSHIGRLNSNGSLYIRSRGDTFVSRTPGSATGLIGNSRGSSSQFVTRVSGVDSTHSVTSSATSTLSHHVFAAPSVGGTPTDHSNGRIAFYSIGEHIDLALLDARATALYNAIGAAIP
jgi:hypothetical protein